MKEIILNNKKWIIPENLNVYLITGDECNCKCRYCVGRLKEGVYNTPSLDREYYKKLSNMLKVLKKELWSVTILGGEPTISPRIFKIFDLIKKYSFKKVMTTNGIMLKNKSFLQKLNESGLNHLNISRHDLNDKGNQSLFQNKNVPSINELKKIVKTLSHSIKIRINCNLIRGHIDSLDKLKKFIEQTKKIGIKEISFSELAKIDEDYIAQKKVIDFCNKNRVFIDRIVKKMKGDKNFKLIKEEIKEDYKSLIVDFFYKGVKFQIRTVNTSLKEKELLSHKNKIYSLKFHPNGVLSASWDPTKKVVLK